MSVLLSVCGVFLCLSAFAQPLDLEEALRRVDQDSPRLAAFHWELNAAEARVLQASLRPNPELSLEVEDIRLGGGGGGPAGESEAGLTFEGGLAPLAGISQGGSNENIGRLRGAEITLSIAQLIELGGKRARRIALATREQQAVAQEYTLLRAEVLAEAAQSFAAVLAAQEQRALAQELLSLLQNTGESIRLRVQAGKVAPLELKRAQTATRLQESQLREREAILNAARIALAGHWGAAEVDFAQAEADFTTLSPLPPLDVLLQRAEANPEVLRWAEETAVRQARIALEKGQARPDLTVRLGLRTKGIAGEDESGWRLGTEGISRWQSRGSREERENALVLELAMPLPLFNRNQGAIQEAEALARRGEAERAASLAAARNLITSLHGTLQGVAGNLQLLRETVLPVAEAAADGARLAYREGKLGLLEMLDTEAALMEARERRVELLSAWHRDHLVLEQTLGGSILDVSSETADKKE